MRATVVPTGACELTSATFESATCANLLQSQQQLPSWASVPDGSCMERNNGVTNIATRSVKIAELTRVNRLIIIANANTEP